jgi:hypothetical protein
MKNTIQSVFLSIALLAIFMSGCTPVSTPPLPTVTSLSPTITPVPSSAADIPSETITAPSVVGSGSTYEGVWEGSPVKFTVEGNEVISQLYLLKDCGIASTPGSAADIDGSKFVVNTSPQTNIQVTISGQFDSDTTASGTISATGGGCEMTATWTATRK